MIGRLKVNEDSWRFVKFLIVGLVNTVFGYAVYAALLWSGLHPQTALALAFAIGVAWNFLTHARIVFRTDGLTRLPVYLVVYGTVYLINRWLLAAALGAGFDPYVAQGVLTLFMAVLTFLGVGAALTGRVPFLGLALPGRFGPGD